VGEKGRRAEEPAAESKQAEKGKAEEITAAERTLLGRDGGKRRDSEGGLGRADAN